MPSTASAAQPPGSPLTAALVAFHQDVATIHETSTAQYGAYADLSTVLSAILPALSKHGIRLSQSFQPWGDDGSAMLLVTSLKHVSGEEEVSRLPLVRANSSRGNAVHDWGGAVTYQRRYAVLAMLGLAAGIKDDDGDAFTASTSTSSGSSSASSIKKAAPPRASNGHVKPAPAPTQPAGLDAAELDRIKKAIVALSPDERSALVAAFRRQFNTPEGQGIADYIKTAEHADFLTLHLSHAAGVN
jgi:hypothetical protein